MIDRIAQALAKLFDRHRIVFWYDAKQELSDNFEVLSLPGVEKLEITNNEYGIKYKLLREQPEQKFLLYHEGPQPADLDNWLLDVQLAHGEFRTDQIGIWLSELELGPEFTAVAQEHVEFLNAAKRRSGLKAMLKKDDTAGLIRLKMLAVCVRTEARIDEILEGLLAELAVDQDDKFKLIARCQLDVFLWEQLKRNYGYQSDSPSIPDFAIELFKSCYAMGTDGPVRLSNEAMVFLRRWKDSIRHRDAFEKLSANYADVLNIEKDLETRDYKRLVDLDYYELIDQKILSDLVRVVVGQTISSGECTLFVRQRRQSHWYKDYQHVYEAIDYAAQFLSVLKDANLAMDSVDNGVARYTQSWFRVDQFYRHFMFHARKSGQMTLLGSLLELVENQYTNNFLLKVNNNWQQVVDEQASWGAPKYSLQNQFFRLMVKPFLRKDRKIYVVISDALRFEIGDDLLSLIRQEDRYDAKLEPILSMLPSFTQLGMAALLPNRELSIAEDETGTVLVDGQSSKGTANRTKILQAGLDGGSGLALRAEDLMKMNKGECRALVRDHDVVYVYHNLIDKVGDERDSEERVFEAADETLQDLMKIIKKLTAANASNLLVTADHGFIYQNRPLDESDFSATAAQGAEVFYRDRRFVLGKGLAEQEGLKKFSAEQLHLTGDLEVQIPKSINRLRLKGSGSRFVHGGATLQETVLPVIHINKKRKSDLGAVDVDILPSASKVITAGQLAVTFYQIQASDDKIQPRTLRAGIYTTGGELISDRHELLFDLTSDNPREREVRVRFVLSREADQANNQEVVLRLDEQVTGTSHYKEYKTTKYLMRRSFTSDFEF